MSPERVARVRALLPETSPGGGKDFLDAPIASPMSIFPEFRTARSFGLDALGTFVVEVETSSGEVGIGVSTGGAPACWLVEHSFAPLVEGRPLDALEEIWERMWRSSLFFGGKGLHLNALSAVDLALWDARGRVRGEPVFRLAGGAAREEIRFYATGPDPLRAAAGGFAGVKVSLGQAGLEAELRLVADIRRTVPDGVFVALDCWMALDLRRALDLVDAIRGLGLRWVEECLPPDDLVGYRQLREHARGDVLVATGEHDATRHGFRVLAELGCCDVYQPDVRWCGGFTEALAIARESAARGALVIPHGAGPFGFHLVAALSEETTPVAELQLPSGAVEPSFAGLFAREPLPSGGVLAIEELDAPGFGLDLAADAALVRPFPRGDD
ncbi:MAG TPA: enolase C-terminal domain-like protein [Gaiellaceae bacterium]|nr:enolase C-terminal domain-like protein [Gaiellaceae bacterium]